MHLLINVVVDPLGGKDPQFENPGIIYQFFENGAFVRGAFVRGGFVRGAFVLHPIFKGKLWWALHESPEW